MDQCVRTGGVPDTREHDGFPLPSPHFRRSPVHLPVCGSAQAKCRCHGGGPERIRTGAEGHQQRRSAGTAPGRRGAGRRQAEPGPQYHYPSTENVGAHYPGKLYGSRPVVVEFTGVLRVEADYVPEDTAVQDEACNRFPGRRAGLRIRSECGVERYWRSAPESRYQVSQRLHGGQLHRQAKRSRRLPEGLSPPGEPVRDAGRTER